MIKLEKCLPTKSIFDFLWLKNILFSSLLWYNKKLLTNGNAFKRTDGRWGGTVWFMDESGERKRKSFSGTTKQEVNKKMTAYIEDFNREIENSIEANKTLKDSMTNWLQVFKFPSVERTTYDRYECTAINQIYPLIGDKIVGNISSADIKKVLNHWMNEGYAYTTVKKSTHYSRGVFQIFNSTRVDNEKSHAFRADD